MKKVYLFVYVSFIMQVAAAQWSITGNSGTNPASNFIGTIDSKDFVIRTNNLERMRITSSGRVYFTNQGNFNLFLGYQAGISNTSGTGNSALGNQALNINTTGNHNTALGSAALYSSKTGNDNTAGGYFSMYVNTSGGYNTAYGSLSLNLNSSGASNVAIGYSALGSNRTASYNTGVGLYAGSSNTNGKENTFIGNSAGRSNDTGSINTFVGSNAGYFNKSSYNTFLGGYAGYHTISGQENVFSGYRAGYNNTSGRDNVFTGYDAGNMNTTGSDNIANGYSALYSNIDGHENTAIGAMALLSNNHGSGNTATGFGALFFNTTGEDNTAIGDDALSANTTGIENTAIGSQAAFLNTSSPYNVCVGSFAGNLMTGTQNTYIGTSAGRDLTTGNYNTCVGINAGYSGALNSASSVTLIGGYTFTAPGLTNVTAIGYHASVITNNSVRLGNSSTTSIGGYAGWTEFSDGRYKKEIRENVPGLAFINELKPVTYHLDVSGLSKFLGEDKIVEGNKEKVSQLSDDQKAIDEKSRKGKEQVVYTGFIAQDVEAAAKKLNYDFSGVDRPQNQNGLYGLRYAEFVVPLVKAVQELSRMNDNKDSTIEDLKSQIQNLRSGLDELKSMVLSGKSSKIPGLPADPIYLNDASLDQNIPNPFNHTTSIGYTLPQRFSSAQILITDKSGKTLKQVNLSGIGKGLVTIDVAMVSPGTYQYSLIVDGKLIGSKQMEILR